MEPHQNSNRNLLIKVIAGIVVLALAAFGYSKVGDKTVVAPVTTDETPITTETTSTTTTTTTDTTPVADNRKYKDGSYTANGMYKSPAGQEEVQITLVIKNDTVTSAQFVGKANNPGSVRAQQLFNEGFSQYVIGKKVDAISLQVVNGSSLTPKGFMDALVKIKAQALVS